MSTSILELRQTTSNFINNGDYNVIMKNPVFLENGDQLAIRNCFIDTASELNGNIVLEQDYNLSLDFYYYIQDWHQGVKFTDLTTPSPIQNADSPSNDLFIMCSSVEHPTGGDKSLQYVTSITFRPYLDSVFFGGHEYPLTFAYEVFGKSHYTHITIPAKSGGYGHAYTMPLNIAVDKLHPNFRISFPPNGTGDGELLDKNEYDCREIGPDATFQTTVVFTDIAPTGSVTYDFHPHSENVNVNITKGSYTPTELAETITDKLSVNSVQNSSTLTNSKFLVTSHNFSNKDEFTYAINFLTTEVDGEQYFQLNINIGTDDLKFYPGQLIAITGITETFWGVEPSVLKGLYTVINADRTGTSPNYFANINLKLPGTSKFTGVPPGGQTLICYYGDTGGYNTVCFINQNGTNGWYYRTTEANQWIGTNQMALEYDDTTNRFQWKFTNMPLYNATGDIITDVLNYKDTANFFIANKNSGIIFNNLSSQPSGFWTDTLGFKLTDICPSFTTLPLTAIGGLNVNGITQSFNGTLIDGINLTGGFIGLDDVIDKSGADTFYKVPLNAFDNTSSDQFKIIATTPITPTQLDSGYFLLEVNSNFNTKFMDEETIYSKISAIVSRYYSEGSYTSSDLSSSIPYIHEGQPVSLSSFRVRILDKNKQLVTNIGDDNCVFIEVIKKK